LDGGHHKNELYVARFIPYFQSQVGYPDLHVTDMLLELVTDNSKILDRLGEREMAMFVYWLRAKMSPPFLRFLRVLCTCERQEVAENQDLVARLLWAEHDKRQLLYLVRGGDGKPLEVKKSADAGWVNIKDFLAPGQKPDVRERPICLPAVAAGRKCVCVCISLCVSVCVCLCLCVCERGRTQ
jgi:hypothetical protein